MNKGLKAYLKLGREERKKILKERKVNKFKYYFMLFASFLASLFVLPAPIFKLANISLTKQIAEKNTFEMTRIFSDSENPKHYWTTLMCILIKGILLVSGIILLGLVTYFLFYIGSLIATLTQMTILSILFLVPAALGLVIFVWGFMINFSPLYYYLFKYKDITISKALNSSIRTMKEQGRKTMFFLDFYRIILIVLYVVVAYIVLSFLLAAGNQASIMVIGYIAMVMFVVFFIFWLPKINLTNRLAKYHLMNDIMLEPDVVENPTLLKEKMVKQGLSKDEFLNNLFDKGVDEESTDEEEKVEEVVEDKKDN